MNANRQPPIFTDACRIATELYGLNVSARSLPGERDYNFHLKTDSGREFVVNDPTATAGGL